MSSKTLSGKIVDVVNERIFPGRIVIRDGMIESVDEMPEHQVDNHYLLPGLTDAHVHVESSMLVPAEFARVAVTHGTVATVSDPHEIGNVLGKAGVDFMISNGSKVPFRFYFGAPSCVPATPFETSGAEITAQDIDELLGRKEIKYLAEMMNFPGVLNKDTLVTDKLDAAKKHGKPVDGHAPGLKGEAVDKYAAAGISTDHECFTTEEALDKIKAGMKIQIREGSAARNFEALIPLLKDYPESIMFCSDDKHPDELIEGHINLLVKRAMKHGYDLLTALKPCTLNPKEHYKLETGLLQKGDPADVLLINNPLDFEILQTYVQGELVAENGESLIQTTESETINAFVASEINTQDLMVKAEQGKIKVIDVKDGQLVTDMMLAEPKIEDGLVVSDVEKDVLKIVVLNRYKKSKPAVGFIHNVGLKKGALVSTVAHDSHNIIAVGVSDDMILKAIEKINENGGGIGYVNEEETRMLPLPVAGIMSNADAWTVAKEYKDIDAIVKQNGSKLSAPFMSVSFMALLVIPSIKISDKGLFDGENFRFVQIFTN